MDNDKNKSNIFFPSFKIERKTKAFNKYIWWFVALISMFSVSLVLLCMFHTFLCWFLNIVSSFIHDNFIFVTFIPVILYILLSYQFLKFLSSLMASYKFEDGQITKGIIQKSNKIKGTDLIIDTALVTNMLKNVSNSSSVVASNTALNMNKIITLIRLNTKKEFVQKYFDTELYKKEVYKNPKLIKENKYSLIYTCNNKKKLVIPKIYDGICYVDNKKETSFLFRIAIRSVIVFVIALFISIADLVIGYSNNTQNITTISNEVHILQENLTSYGYTCEKVNEKMYTFSKSVGEKTSKISYYLDKNGNIDNVNIQLYYNSNYPNIEKELIYIISTINDEFNSSDISEFVSLVHQNIQGNLEYGSLRGRNYKLTLGTSQGYIDIHSY